MPNIEQYFERTIDQKLKKQNDVNTHTPSGKLSASGLGNPTQWQILKTLAVKTTEHDEYTLRKFQRGKDVEDRIIELLDPIKKQEPVEYRDVVGFADAFMNTSDWDFPCGIIPVEVKSVTNAKFKRIVGSSRIQGSGAQRGHKLQGALYALARGCSHFTILYVASDDYRTIAYTFKTEDFKEEIDSIIDKYNYHKEKGIIPIFEPMEDWQSNEKYNPYPEWMGLTEEEIKQLQKNLNINF